MLVLSATVVAILVIAICYGWVQVACGNRMCWCSLLSGVACMQSLHSQHTAHVQVEKEEEDLDKEMGDAGEAADVVDEKMWEGDDDEDQACIPSHYLRLG